jgi:hypothetical protein
VRRKITVIEPMQQDEGRLGGRVTQLGPVQATAVNVSEMVTLVGVTYLIATAQRPTIANDGFRMQGLTADSGHVLLATQTWPSPLASDTHAGTTTSMATSAVRIAARAFRGFISTIRLLRGRTPSSMVRKPESDSWHDGGQLASCHLALSARLGPCRVFAGAGLSSLRSTDPLCTAT